MTSRSVKFDPETWLQGDREAERLLSRDQLRRREAQAEPRRAAPPAAAERTGIRAILESGLAARQRLPMLDVVLDRLARMLTTSLRSFTADTVEVAVDAIESVRVGDFLDSVPQTAMIGVFHVREWTDSGLLVFDGDLVRAMLDVLLGGRRIAATVTPPRDYTAIEVALAERVAGIVMTDLSAAFAPLSPATFQLDRMETTPRFASMAQPASAAICVRLRVEMEDRGGCFRLFVPYAMLEPVRALLLQRFAGETFGKDALWERHLAAELRHTRVAVKAVLGEQRMTLADVMAFKVGQTILFGASSHAPITLRCGESVVARGRMGRVGTAIAVQVDGDAAMRDARARFRDE